MNENWEDSATYDYRVIVADEPESSLHETLGHWDIIERQKAFYRLLSHPGFVFLDYCIDLTHITIKRN